MSLQVLVVEDDLDLAATIVDYLALEDMQIEHALNGEAGLRFARARRYDVIVLDITMPRMNGLEVCQALRREGIDTPVIMLTARDTLDDKLAGFDAGTDDYAVKPLDLPELVARIRSLARRRSGQSRVLTVGDLVLDLDQREVTRGGQKLKVSPIGWRLLEALMRASPAVVSRRRLQEAVWGDEPPESNSLAVHLSRLRQDVDRDFAKHLIETVPGHGVALRPPNDT